MKFEDGEITFRKDIREAIFTDDAIVVCLAVSTDEMDNENVIGVDTSGDRLWEIEPVVPTSERDAPFMNLVERDGALWALNWRGDEYRLDPRTGAILEKRFRRF